MLSHHRSPAVLATLSAEAAAYHSPDLTLELTPDFMLIEGPHHADRDGRAKYGTERRYDPLL
jgi:hypothetical protein